MLTKKLKIFKKNVFPLKHELIMLLKSLCEIFNRSDNLNLFSRAFKNEFNSYYEIALFMIFNK